MSLSDPNIELTVMEAKQSIDLLAFQPLRFIDHSPHTTVSIVIDNVLKKWCLKICCYA